MGALSPEEEVEVARLTQNLGGSPLILVGVVKALIADVRMLNRKVEVLTREHGGQLGVLQTNLEMLTHNIQGFSDQSEEVAREKEERETYLEQHRISQKNSKENLSLVDEDAAAATLLVDEEVAAKAHTAMAAELAEEDSVVVVEEEAADEEEAVVEEEEEAADEEEEAVVEEAAPPVVVVVPEEDVGGELVAPVVGVAAEDPPPADVKPKKQRASMMAVIAGAVSDGRHGGGEAFERARKRWHLAFHVLKIRRMRKRVPINMVKADRKYSLAARLEALEQAFDLAKFELTSLSQDSQPQQMELLKQQGKKSEADLRKTNKEADKAQKAFIARLLALEEKQAPPVLVETPSQKILNAGPTPEEKQKEKRLKKEQEERIRLLQEAEEFNKARERPMMVPASSSSSEDDSRLVSLQSRVKVLEQQVLATSGDAAELRAELIATEDKADQAVRFVEERLQAEEGARAGKEAELQRHRERAVFLAETLSATCRAAARENKRCRPTAEFFKEYLTKLQKSKLLGIFHKATDTNLAARRKRRLLQWHVSNAEDPMSPSVALPKPFKEEEEEEDEGAVWVEAALATAREVHGLILLLDDADMSLVALPVVEYERKKKTGVVIVKEQDISLPATAFLLAVALREALSRALDSEVGRFELESRTLRGLECWCLGPQGPRGLRQQGTNDAHLAGIVALQAKSCFETQPAKKTRRKSSLQRGGLNGDISGNTVEEEQEEEEEREKRAIANMFVAARTAVDQVAVLKAQLEDTSGQMARLEDNVEEKHGSIATAQTALQSLRRDLVKLARATVPKDQIDRLLREKMDRTDFLKLSGVFDGGGGGGETQGKILAAKLQLPDFRCICCDTPLNSVNLTNFNKPPHFPNPLPKTPGLKSTCAYHKKHDEIGPETSVLTVETAIMPTMTTTMPGAISKPASMVMIGGDDTTYSRYPRIMPMKAKTALKQRPATSQLSTSSSVSALLNPPPKQQSPKGW